MSSNTAGAGIVVGVDGSAASRAAVRWGAQEAERRALPLTLVHAASTRLSPLMARWAVFGQHELPHRRVQRIVDDAVGVATDSASDGAPAQLNTQVEFTDPVDALEDLSRRADLVVVGSSGRWRLWHLLFGSVGAELTLPLPLPTDRTERGGRLGDAAALSRLRCRGTGRSDGLVTVGPSATLEAHRDEWVTAGEQLTQAFSIHDYSGCPIGVPTNVDAPEMVAQPWQGVTNSDRSR